ncbi:c-type cytochrome [Novosphingobium sp. G106]|uniref:c-type cytochrome n=1 Tax=Novosphingobium sp. G106 TaxID=2849500 RepID=UPI001C2CF429|nr:c-type cytochrome [Novosphingobium sp. G106]MBV1691379.1 c-type cytochrome [Novosphingobium sp. G106]
MKTPGVVAIALATGAIGASISGWVGWHGRSAPRAGVVATNTGYEGPASIALGDIAGGAVPTGAIDLANPFGNDPAAVADGKRLFTAMNCAGCHGYTGAGGMGPPLNDHYWRYGGAPAQIYKSIYEGRPKGMPAWGHALPADQLWKLTAFVSSLGGGVPPQNAVAALRGDQIPGQKDWLTKPGEAARAADEK